MIRLFLSLSVLFFGQGAFSQNINTEKLDAYFDALQAKQKLMGNVMIAKDGKPIYAKSIGFANVEKGIKNHDNTRFRIGSISKTFTAVLVLKALEDKKLNLTDKLSIFYPSLQNSQKITIENMLYHRSGIYNITSDTQFFQWKNTLQPEQNIIGMLSKYSPVFEPDTQAEYSNSNYILLSYILQKVYKKSFAQLLEEKITQPLGLKNTAFSGRISPLLGDAQSYQNEGKGWALQTETDLSFVLGAGGITSTTADLVAFHQGLFEGKLLKKESLEAMKTLKDGYGMGIFLIPFGEKKAYSHTGGIDGFHSVLGTFLNENITFVRLTNGLDFNLNDIDLAVLSAVFGRDFQLPSFEEKAVDTSAEKYVGTYSTSVIPMKIKVFWQGKQLMAQATGQQAFLLEEAGRNIFKFEMAGIVMEFPENGKMTLKQGGGSFHFTREIPKNTPNFTPSQTDLKSYEGTYGTEQLPLKITFFIENGKLMSQATGQQAFELEAVKRHHFRFEPAAITLEFIPTENKIKFTQGRMVFELKRM